MSRNGFWWEKSQKSLSGSREGWDEREEGYKCFAQIKQPKKNKGRKELQATASIFFQVNFFPLSLSIWGGVKLELAEGSGRMERGFCAFAGCPSSL